MVRKDVILQILYPGIGGHSSVAFSIIEGDKDNFYTHKLLGYGIEEPSTSFVNKAEEVKVNYTSVKKKKGLSLKSWFKVYSQIKEAKPDVIIMHSTSLIICVWLYRLFNSIGFISVEHQANDAKTKKDWIYSFLILMLSPKIVYLTKNYWREIKNKLNRVSSGKAIRIINNGINIRKFKPKTELKEEGKLNFSMISRMTDLRDHYTLIDAFQEISKNKDYKLFLAGDGDTKKELEDYVTQKNLSSKITFTGNINENSVIDLIHKTDIYIHSSLAETLSTSILQVMACKVPIIASDIPGINNLLMDSEEALLFKPKNINHLIEKMVCLMSSVEMRSKLALNAYNKIKEKFSSEAMFVKYKSFIKE